MLLWNVPSGAKARFLEVLAGTTEVVPFPFLLWRRVFPSGPSGWTGGTPVLHLIYFCGGGAGLAGWDLAGADLTPWRTELVPLWREAATERVIEVTIKMMADQVVALERMVAAPRGPKAV